MLAVWEEEPQSAAPFNQPRWPLYFSTRTLILSL